MAERIEHGFVCPTCHGQRLVTQAAQAPRVRLGPRCCGEPMRLALKRRLWCGGWAEVRWITTYGRQRADEEEMP